MQAAQELLRVASCRSSYTQVAVMIAAPYHARLVCHAKAIGAVVAPEGFRTDMAARAAFGPLQVAVGKELPRVPVVHFMFV